MVLSNGAVLHYPRLDTVMMVEKTIKDSPKDLTKNALWRSLPKQVQYQTFKLIIDYLEEQGKIFFHTDGTIVWTWDPEGVKKALKNGVRVR